MPFFGMKPLGYTGFIYMFIHSCCTFKCHALLETIKPFIFTHMTNVERGRTIFRITAAYFQVWNIKQNVQQNRERIETKWRMILVNDVRCLTLKFFFQDEGPLD